jgi:hypothetical protein
MPQDQTLLLAKTSATLREIERLEQVLEDSHIHEDLRQRVANRFAVKIKNSRRAVQAIIATLERGATDSSSWTELREARRQIVPLYREFAAFVQGALVRSAGLDEGLCEIGDAMAAELSRRTGPTWDGLTILGPDSESYVDLAGLIRLPFPQTGVWDLPIVGHEFGHFVAPLLYESTFEGARAYRLKDYLAERASHDPRGARHLGEQFADLFAAYALGPAYACTCVVLRFDVLSAFDDGPFHPSPAKRVYWILKLLEKLDTRAGLLRPYAPIIDRLRSLWSAGLAAAAPSGGLSDKDVSVLDQELAQMFELFDQLVPDQARYDSWSRAQGLATGLDPDRDSLPRLQNGETIVDIVNAGWLARLYLNSENALAVRTITERVAKLCSQKLSQG